MEIPKHLGGLGLRNLNLKNLGLLLKWWWRFSKDDESLWKRILKSTQSIESNYASFDCFKNIRMSTFSEINRAMKQYQWLQPLVQSNLSVKIGSGESILFWHDRWVEARPLKESFQRLFSVSSQQNNKISEMGEWVDSEWRWSFHWRRNLYSWEVEDLRTLKVVILSQQPRLNKEEEVMLKDNTVVGFTVRSFTEEAEAHWYQRMLNQNVTEFIWQRRAPPRAELVVWFLALEKLKTGDYLLGLNLIEPEMALCPICLVFVETNSHLIFSCRFSWQIWTNCFQWWDVTTVFLENPVTNIESWSCLVQGKV